MRKVALITGITGQDGSFLAEFLLEKGYDVMYMAPFAAHLLISGNGSRIWKAIPLSIFTMRI